MSRVSWAKLAVLLAVVVLLVVAWTRAKQATDALAKERDAARLALAGFKVAAETSERGLKASLADLTRQSADLAAEVERLKKASPGAKPTRHSAFDRAGTRSRSDGDGLPVQVDGQGLGVRQRCDAGDPRRESRDGGSHRRVPRGPCAIDTSVRGAAEAGRRSGGGAESEAVGRGSGRVGRVVGLGCWSGARASAASDEVG
jgi:Sec-independent protein translocase protein TatA